METGYRYRPLADDEEVDGVSDKHLSKTIQTTEGYFSHPTRWYDTETNKAVLFDPEYASQIAKEYEAKTGNKFTRHDSEEAAIGSGVSQKSYQDFKVKITPEIMQMAREMQGTEEAEGMNTTQLLKAYVETQLKEKGLTDEFINNKLNVYGDLSPEENFLLEFSDLREAGFMKDAAPEIVKGALTVAPFTKGFSAGTAATLPYLAPLGPGGVFASGTIGFLSGLVTSALAYEGLNLVQEKLGLKAAEVLPSEEAAKTGYKAFGGALGGGLYGIGKSSLKYGAKELAEEATESLAGKVSEATLTALEKNASSKAIVGRFVNGLEKAARETARNKGLASTAEFTGAVATGFAAESVSKLAPDSPLTQLAAETVAGAAGSNVSLVQIVPKLLGFMKEKAPEIAADVSGMNSEAREFLSKKANRAVFEELQKMFEDAGVVDSKEKMNELAEAITKDASDPDSLRFKLKEAFPNIDYEKFNLSDLASAHEGGTSDFSSIFRVLEGIEYAEGDKNIVTGKTKLKKNVDQGIKEVIAVISKEAERTGDEDALKSAAEAKAALFDKESTELLEQKVNKFMESKRRILGHKGDTVSKKELMDMDQEMTGLIKDHYEAMKQVTSRYYKAVGEKLNNKVLLFPDGEEPELFKVLADPEVAYGNDLYDKQLYSAMGNIATMSIKDIKEKLGKRSILTEEGLSKKAKLSEKYYSVFPDTLKETMRIGRNKSEAYKAFEKIVEEATKKFPKIEDNGKLITYLSQQTKELYNNPTAFLKKHGLKKIDRPSEKKALTRLGTALDGEIRKLEKIDNDYNKLLSQSSVRKEGVTYRDLDLLQRNLSDQIKNTESGTDLERRLIAIQNAVTTDLRSAVKRLESPEDQQLLLDATALFSRTKQLEREQLIKPLINAVGVDSKRKGAAVTPFLETLFKPAQDPTDIAIGQRIDQIHQLIQHYTSNNTAAIVSKGLDEPMKPLQTAEGLMLTTIKSILSEALDEKGNINPNGYNEWIRKNQELAEVGFLKKFFTEDLDELSTELSAYTKAEKQIKSRENDLNLVRTLLNKKNGDLGVTPLNALRNGLSRGNLKELKTLLNLHKNANGEVDQKAKNGLRELIFSYAYEGSINPQNEAFIDGSLFRRNLFSPIKDNRNYSLMDLAKEADLFSDMEYKRYKTVASLAENIAEIEKGVRKKRPEDSAGFAKQTVGRLSGTAAVSALKNLFGFTSIGAGDLVVHGAAARAGEYYTSKLGSLTKREVMRDILNNPELFAAITKVIETEKDDLSVAATLKKILGRFKENASVEKALPFLAVPARALGTKAIPLAAPQVRPVLENTFEEEPQPASQPPTPRRTSQVPQNTAPEPFLQGMLQQQGQRPQQMAQLTPEQKERGTQELAESMGIGSLFS